MKAYLALTLLILSALACMQPVATVTPEPTPTPSPTRTPAPTASAVPTPSPAPLSDTQTATVKAAIVNVRQLPNGDVIGHLEAGQSVSVIGCEENWCEISDPHGFVFIGCLSIADGQGCEAK